MTPQLFVASAGSSNPKFALFTKNGTNQPVADASGQLEGIGIQPRFTVKDATGVTAWPLPTNENLMIVRHTLNQVMLSAGGGWQSTSQVPNLLKIRTRKSFP
jgi:acetate kinase